MSNLPSAELSPRVVNGVIKWYQGDTFLLDIEIDLTDEDGHPIAIAEDDTVSIHIIDRTGGLVYDETFTDIQNNTIRLNMDGTKTALFREGDYHYDIYLSTAEKRTTILNAGKMVVE